MPNKLRRKKSIKLLGFVSNETRTRTRTRREKIESFDKNGFFFVPHGVLWFPKLSEKHVIFYRLFSVSYMDVRWIATLKQWESEIETKGFQICLFITLILMLITHLHGDAKGRREAVIVCKWFGMSVCAVCFQLLFRLFFCALFYFT